MVDYTKWKVAQNRRIVTRLFLSHLISSILFSMPSLLPLAGAFLFLFSSQQTQALLNSAKLASSSFCHHLLSTEGEKEKKRGDLGSKYLCIYRVTILIHKSYQIARESVRSGRRKSVDAHHDGLGPFSFTLDREDSLRDKVDYNYGCRSKSRSSIANS